MTIEKLAPLLLPTISEETPTDGSVKAVIDGVPFVYSEAGWIVDGHSASFGTADGRTVSVVNGVIVHIT